MMRLEVISRAPTTVPRSTPILFVHGAWHGAWAWEDHYLPYFADHGYHVHALSLRGHGNSEGRAGLRWYSISDYVADIKQVADTLPAPPIIIAHSMGGYTLFKYLEQYSAAAGVLVAALPTVGALGMVLRLLSKNPVVFVKMLAQLKLYPLVGTPELARRHLYTPATADAIVQRTYERLQDESFRVFIEIALQSFTAPKPLRAPVMVIGAENDGFFTPDEQRAIARAANTTAIIVPDTGHNMMCEASWQTSADHILAWLAERGL
ncbi:MAG: alpha/beta fold hydrolase [Chloroflexi bacterium]|uniref:alpha/beta hydrolase n=1 Tax=Candidatus Flexifilum breve TaxID=3140694 RepID=UPI0031347B65|nr:alpha/beta fold hydrolase [Chloroflexota bacterium]